MATEEQPTAILPMAQTLGHYRIVSKLGAGGMGEVWLAEDTRLKRKVALKLLLGELTADAVRVRRFEQEAQAASALSHPNIITVYDIGECEAGRFIVMELVAGRTLRRVIAEDNSLETLLTLGQQMAKALSAAHTAGITHRDIKPDNIMVRDDGYVKVLDFGLARLRPATESDSEAATLAQQTTPGTVMGTVAYMSPEQARGEIVSHPSDVFALGIVLYELATGRHPFKAETLVGYLHAITLQEPPPLTQWKPELPAALNDLILRMLRKDARQRPTANEAAQSLREIERQLEHVSSEVATLMLSASPASLPSAKTPPSPLSNSVPTQADASGGHPPSIAVLPFANISTDEENEYFCDGLAEELLNALSKIEALRVAARTSAFSFKGKDTDIREIGQKLNVGTVLEGSVRKASNRLRITAQLVNVADGYHLWSERYDRELQDIFDIQDEISLAIVDALKVKLLGAEKAAVLKRHTDDAETYELYLKGRFHFSKLTEDGIGKAIAYYQQAIAKEPNYALAFAGLANCYLHLWYYSYLPPDEAVPHLRAAAARALAIDSTLSEAHLALARLTFYHEWDWPETERKFQQALALNPNYAEAHEEYGVFLAVMNRPDEAVGQGKRALELDPLSLLTNFNVGWLFWVNGQLDQLLTQGEKLLELEPYFFGGHWLTATAALLQGRVEQALAEFAIAVQLGGGPAVMANLGCAYGLVGQPDKARQQLNQLQALRAERYIGQYDEALIYAGLGETERAFAGLERAHELHEGMLVFLRQIAPLIPSLRDDPRLTDLLRRIGLPQ
jgi:serine/threonine-protein kinase